MQNITAKNIEKFFETNFLVPKKSLKTKLSNYKELADYINERADNYRDSKVSRERISHLTIVLKGPVKEKSCGVCFEDYEKGQEVCRFPCNHFCCGKCTKQMFEIPNDGSDALFQCPICRHDCT